MKRLTKGIVLTGALVLMTPAMVFAAEEETESLQFGEASEYGYLPVTGLEDSTVMEETGEMRAAGLPSYFNLADEGRVTEVKNQEATGLCWTFSAIASSESGLISRGLADETLDLSEAHLGWAAYNGAEETYIPYENWLKAGGNHILTTAALANWYGVADEESAPFTTDANTEYERSLSESHIRNVYYYPEFYNSSRIFQDASVEQVKTAVIDKGAVEAGWYSGGGYDPQTNSFYSDSFRTPNHQLAIVGWDDEKETAAAWPGAWIVKNSYGKDWRDGGYAYISYYDTSLDTPTFYEYENSLDGTHDYGKLYSYDGTGRGTRSSLSRENGTLVGANVFTASSRQVIQAAGVYLDAESDYTVTLYKGLKKTEDGTVDWSNKSVAAQISSFSDTAGYYTVDLGKAVTVEPGQTFAIAVCAESKGKTYQYYEGGSRAATALKPGRHTVIQEGQSFVSVDNGTNWTDASVRLVNDPNLLSNLCIKAFANEHGHWQKQDGSYYYVKYDGSYQNGWLLLGSKWYYLENDGKMAIGWKEISGKCYYLSGSQNDGAMKIGWQFVDGKWYYMGSSGAMKIGWQFVDGKWYYMGSSGAMKIGWQLVDGKWYYLSDSMSKGYMSKNCWIRTDGKWYYMQNSGAMAVNKWIDRYYVDGSGKWTKTAH